jgi:hypothetical protein
MSHSPAQAAKEAAERDELIERISALLRRVPPGIAGWSTRRSSMFKASVSKASAVVENPKASAYLLRQVETDLRQYYEGTTK